jgi:hypothetical protein
MEHIVDGDVFPVLPAFWRPYRNSHSVGR